MAAPTPNIASVDSSSFPQPNLTVRHALGLWDTLQFLGEHFHSFFCLVPDSVRDKTSENRVTESLQMLEDRFREMLMWFSSLAVETDEDYLENVEGMTRERMSEYHPVQQLAEVQRLRRESSKWFLGKSEEPDELAESVWTDVDHLAKLVRAKRPPTDKLRKLFEQAVGNLGEDKQPTRADLLRARDAFFAEPPQKLRDLLNGWAPAPIRPHRPERPGLSPDVQRRLIMSSGLKDGSAPYVTQEWESDDDISPVILQIAEGTSKQEALKALHLFESQIRKLWPVMVGYAPGLAGSQRGEVRS